MEKIKLCLDMKKDSADSLKQELKLAKAKNEELNKQISFLTNVKNGKAHLFKPEEVKTVQLDWMDKNVESEDFSRRVLNVLDNLNIRTVKQLMETKPSHLVKSRNCGRKSLSEITQFFKEKGVMWE